MKKKILKSIGEGINAISQLSDPQNLDFIQKSAELLAHVFQDKKKVLIAGNGGSLCDASHFAEELTGFFRKKRHPLPAIAISDPGYLTCVGNDLGFEYIFGRAIEAYGEADDLFIGLTTSGNSQNLVNAFQTAKKQNLKTIAFLGKGGGKLRGIADLEILICDLVTSDRIQEAHMAAIHIIIEMMEEILFSETQKELIGTVMSV
ncbi:MAG: SIS domain-containing protein [Chlamydiales bacterium]